MDSCSCVLMHLSSIILKFEISESIQYCRYNRYRYYIVSWTQLAILRNAEKLSYPVISYKLYRKTLKSLKTAWNQDIKRLVLQPNLVCLKNKVVVKPGITFEDQSIENKLQCFHVKEYGKVLKIWLSTKVMALSLILEQVVGHFTIDRIADFFFTLVEQLLRPRGGGWLVIF